MVALMMDQYLPVLPSLLMREKYQKSLWNIKRLFLFNAGPEKNVREIVVQMKKILKVKGFNKALTLSAQPCDLCDPCTTATNCKFPKKARLILRACGIDMKETIHNNGQIITNQLQE